VGGLPADPPPWVVYLGGPRPDVPRLAAFLTACSLVADGATSLAGRMHRQGENWLPRDGADPFRLQRERSVFAIELQAPADAFDEIERRLFTAASWPPRASGSRSTWSGPATRRSSPGGGRTAAEIFHSLILDTEKPVKGEYFQEWKKALAAVGEEGHRRRRPAPPHLPQAEVLELPGRRRARASPPGRSGGHGGRGARLGEGGHRPPAETRHPAGRAGGGPGPRGVPRRINAVVPSGILRGPEVLLEENYRWPLVWMCVAYPGGALVRPAGSGASTPGAVVAACSRSATTRSASCWSGWRCWAAG